MERERKRRSLYILMRAVLSSAREMSPLASLSKTEKAADAAVGEGKAGLKSVGMR